MTDITLTHLASALTFKSRTGNTGTCVQRAAALMLDLRNATLMFGVVRAATPEELEKNPDASPVPFIHAWVEWRGDVYSPSSIEKFKGELLPLPKDVYYRANAVSRTWPLEPKAFQAVAKRFGLSAAFRHGKDRAGDGAVTDALLKAAGVKWKLSERRTLLPAE
jgi:hypothetical protein